MAKIYGYQITKDTPEKPAIFKTKEGRDDALKFYVEQNWGDIEIPAPFEEYVTGENGDVAVKFFFTVMGIKTGKQALYFFESDIEDFEDEYPVERVISMSIRHMPGRDADFSSLLHAWDETGHVYVVQVDTEEKMAEVPEWMRPAAAYAYERKCQFIVFDSLADEIDGIPVYDWKEEERVRHKWTRPYHGVTHMEGIPKRFQITMRVGEEKCEVYMVDIENPKGAFHKVKRFLGEEHECIKKADRWASHFARIN